jgi:hypothetical protein
MRFLAAMVLVSLIASSRLLLAQRAPGMLISSPPPHVPATPRHFLPSPIFWGAPWFADYSPIQQPAPAVIIVQPQPAAPEAKKEESKPITPLLIELQNGHYVRADAKVTTASQDEPTPTQVARNKDVTHSQVTRESQPAVLVFLDGHREKVREYTLADGALYVHGDYWIDGYWNKKILLTSLDLPATMAVNQESGVAFVLPSGPNVVMIGP